MMSKNTRIRGIVFVILTVLIASFCMFPKVEAYSPIDQESEPGTEINMTEEEFKPVFFSMRANNKLMPDPFLGNNSPMFVSVPAEFVPASWSIMGKFGSYQWVDVGTWTSKPAKTPVKIDTQSRLQYQFTIQNTGDLSLVSGEFELTVKVGGRTIGNPIAIEDVDVSYQSTVVITGAANTNFNISDIRAGETISISIRALVDVDGIRILYDSAFADSGIIITCKPVEIKEVKGCTERVHVSFTDAFDLNWVTLAKKGYVKMFVDNAEIREDLDVSKDTYGNVVVSWKYGLLPGDNHLVTIITYRGNCSWMKSNLQKLPTTGYFGLGEVFDPTKPMFFVFIGIIIVGCISGAFGYRRYPKKSSKNEKVVEKRVKGRMQRPGMPKAGLKIDANNGMKQPKVNGCKIVRPGMPKKDI
ncbi:MAG: hypothetical protein QXT63_01240 [Thermoplasmata archaeon]